MRGQANVGGLVALLILIAIGAVVLYEVTGSFDTTSSRTTVTSQTANSALSDNTGNVPDNWENLTDPAVSITITNSWNAAGDLRVTRTDNADNNENGVWYQSLTLSSTQDGISSAIAAFEYRVIDNENAGSIIVRVQLCNGTDNTTLFVDNVTANESASWTAVENDVSSVITTTGIYTLYLRAELNSGHESPITDCDGSSIIVGFDDASISVTTYGMGYAENAVGQVESRGYTSFNLLTILAIVIVAALIISVVVGSIGGRTGGGPTR